MSRRSRTQTCALASVGLGMLAFAGSAAAADLPLKAPALKTVYDWTGFYIGGHVGYGGGSLGPGTNPVPEEGFPFPPSITGLIGGYQAGYNWQFSNHVVLGIEADASFGSPVDAPTVWRRRPSTARSITSARCAAAPDTPSAAGCRI